MKVATNYYNKDNKITHFIQPNGYEVWYKYDEKGNIINFRDSQGKESWYNYNENNNIIYARDNKDIEIFYEYNSENKLIHQYNNIDTYEELYEYDDRGNITHMKRIYNKNTDKCCVEESWYKYDKFNNKVYHKNSQGDEDIYEYDDNNNLLYHKDKYGEIKYINIYEE